MTAAAVIGYKMKNHLKAIAKIRTEFPTKFGVPRQSGIIDELRGKIIFEPEFRNPAALRGLEGFSHIWLLWEFSQTEREGWLPTVRPPKLGGNTRMGVFATRSPFRPNPIGLSSVRLERIEEEHDLGRVLIVAGADLVDGTPIYDIKPYLPYADCHPNATSGFVPDAAPLAVDFPAELLALIPPDRRAALISVLEQDPRPSYQDDPERVYGFGFCGFEIKFTVSARTLHITSVCPD